MGGGTGGVEQYRNGIDFTAAPECSVSPPFLHILVSPHPSLPKIGQILSGYYNSNRSPPLYSRSASGREMTDTLLWQKAWEKPLQNISDMDQPNHVPVGHMCDFMEKKKTRRQHLAAEGAVSQPPSEICICGIFFLCVWTHTKKEIFIIFKLWYYRLWIQRRRGDREWRGVKWFQCSNSWPHLLTCLERSP